MSEPAINMDAYSPAQIAERVETVGVLKARLPFLNLFILSILAGAFISLGAVFMTLVVHDSKLSFGLTQLLGGVTFSLGLILVVVAGAELFTGNNLIVMAYVSRKISLSELLRNWVIAYFGNFIGALTMALWIYFSNYWTLDNHLVGGKALLIANSKVHLIFGEAVVRGILCNVLVCLAVWLCFSGRSVIDKVAAILFPITAFVACGFEHCIANMYFIPLGLLLRSDEAVRSAASALAGRAVDSSGLSISTFLFQNLLPVTLGNIIGGGVLVAFVYWLVYLRGKNHPS